VRIGVPRTLARALGPVVSGLASTWRVETVHEERWQQISHDPGPLLVLLWHDALLPLLWHHRGRGVVVVVSRARDGQYLVDQAHRLGYRTVEGSSHRGRVQAMRGALRALEERAIVAITPDGPRGPRRVIKPGGLAAAQATGARVITLHAEARPARRLGSWDRFLVPWPLARVRIAYGPVFTVEPGERGVGEAVARATRDLALLEQEIAWPGATPTA
jgi:lysophospholipid acyltransferase (LPLAT)-like uncharacterized protein